MVSKVWIILSVLAVSDATKMKQFSKVGNLKVDSNYPELKLKESFKVKDRLECGMECITLDGCEMMALDNENMCGLYSNKTALMHTSADELSSIYSTFEVEKCFNTHVFDQITNTCKAKLDEYCENDNNCFTEHRCRLNTCVDYFPLGCFLDSQYNNDLNNNLNSFYSPDMTTEKCIEFCKQNNNFFAATQNRNNCYCGNSFGKYGKLEDSECNKPCDGNQTQMCGAELKNSIYFINSGSLNEPAVLMGCYKDAKDDRDLFEGHHSDAMTHEYCFSRCKYMNYLFAGLQGGGDCFCGNQYGKHGEAPMNDCDSKCKGDPNLICGGGWRNQIYFLKP